MTPDQQANAQAWASVFQDSAQTAYVLDDMTVFCNGLPPEQQAGAAKLLLWILLKRSTLRRVKARGNGGGKL